MAMNHSQKKRLENVWEALKHDKIAIFSIIFLALILIALLKKLKTLSALMQLAQ